MENKPICRIDKHGAKIWYLNGVLHREDGPAIMRPTGGMEWWVNDKLHRFDGPAVIKKSGRYEWWINGFYVHDLITKWAKENDIDLDNLTEVDKALIKLVWADYNE